MRETSKHSFTLLEILLVIALVGLVMGIFAIQLPKAISTEIFEKGISEIKMRITLAEELMLNYRTDVFIDFHYNPEKKGINAIIQTARPLPEKIKNQINRQSLVKGIEMITFGEEQTANPTLYFDSTLGTTPKGKLILKSYNREVSLILKGFPSQILKGDDTTDDKKADYPEKIFSLI
ncbi:MAG: hypothetical protein R3E91_03605 [Chlamydiales bacterium]